MRLSIERPRAAQGAAALNGKELLWHPRFQGTKLLSAWLKHCLLHSYCQPHRHVRGAWLAIQGATDHSNMKWELISNVLYLIISIKCHRDQEWLRREGTLFSHRMTLQQRDLTSPGRSPNQGPRPGPCEALFRECYRLNCVPLKFFCEALTQSILMWLYLETQPLKR